MFNQKNFEKPNNYTSSSYELTKIVKLRTCALLLHYFWVRAEIHKNKPYPTNVTTIIWISHKTLWRESNRQTFNVFFSAMKLVGTQKWCFQIFLLQPKKNFE